MGKNNNIIEINGKTYDARTGEILSSSKTNLYKTTPKSAHMTKPDISKPKIKTKRVTRGTAKTIKHHPTKSSKTLMRSSVKKPVEPLKRRVKAQGPSEVPASVHVNTKKPKTAIRKSVKNNPLIRHFAPIEPTVIEQPVIKAAMATNQNIDQTSKIQGKTKQKTTADLLENAINNATSHQLKPVKLPKNRKKHGIAVAAIVSVLLVGFVSYQEIPNIKLELASAKAGFSAGLPAYKPAGFSLGEVNYSPGVVSTTFNSNSDERAYTLTQKTSNWNSQELLELFVKKNSNKYQTVSSAGNTIYIYGDSNATWINGGVWYVIQSNGSLTQSQVIKLANTL